MRDAPLECDWQLVLILWGTKYGIVEVNHLIRTVQSCASQLKRVVLITDRYREGLESSVIQRLFPEFYLQPHMTGRGCRAKLAMFEEDVVPGDLPAVYLDIDTVVLGDLTKLLNLMAYPQTIAMLQSSLVPLGPIGHVISRLTRGKYYTRGNSSIVVYHPGECAFIAERFRSLFAEYGYQLNGRARFRPMATDDHFISWSAPSCLRTIPQSMAVKFRREFMLPWRWLIHLRSVLPRVRRRREQLLAITLPGLEAKAQALLNLSEGEEVVDRKGRRLIWTDRALGATRRRIIDYYQAMERGR